MGEVARGRSGAFLRLAAVEVVVFAATIGVRVGLSRTPAPISGITVGEGDTVGLLAYPVAAEPTLGRLATHWLPQLLFIIIITTAVVAAVAYAAGARR